MLNNNSIENSLQISFKLNSSVISIELSNMSW